MQEQEGASNETTTEEAKELAKELASMAESEPLAKAATTVAMEDLRTQGAWANLRKLRWRSVEVGREGQEGVVATKQTTDELAREAREARELRLLNLSETRRQRRRGFAPRAPRVLGETHWAIALLP